MAANKNRKAARADHSMAYSHLHNCIGHLQRQTLRFEPQHPEHAATLNELVIALMMIAEVLEKFGLEVLNIALPQYAGMAGKHDGDLTDGRTFDTDSESGGSGATVHTVNGGED